MKKYALFLILLSFSLMAMACAKGPSSNEKIIITTGQKGKVGDLKTFSVAGFQTGDTCFVGAQPVACSLNSDGELEIKLPNMIGSFDFSFCSAVCDTPTVFSKSFSILAITSVDCTVDTDCSTDGSKVCENSVCVDAPAGPACTQNSECSSDGSKVCENSQCVDRPCTQNSECSSDGSKICQNSQCVQAECLNHGDCQNNPNGDVCRSGICVPECTMATQATDCSAGNHCENQRCVLSCTATGHECANSTNGALVCDTTTSDCVVCVANTDCATGQACQNYQCITPPECTVATQAVDCPGGTCQADHCVASPLTVQFVTSGTNATADLNSTTLGLVRLAWQIAGGGRLKNAYLYGPLSDPADPANVNPSDACHGDLVVGQTGVSLNPQLPRDQSFLPFNKSDNISQCDAAGTNCHAIDLARNSGRPNRYSFVTYCRIDLLKTNTLSGYFHTLMHQPKNAYWIAVQDEAGNWYTDATSRQPMVPSQVFSAPAPKMVLNLAQQPADFAITTDSVTFNFSAQNEIGIPTVKANINLASSTSQTASCVVTLTGPVTGAGAGNQYQAVCPLGVDSEGGQIRANIGIKVIGAGGQISGGEVAFIVYPPQLTLTDNGVTCADSGVPSSDCKGTVKLGWKVTRSYTVSCSDSNASQLATCAGGKTVAGLSSIEFYASSRLGGDNQIASQPITTANVSGNEAHGEYAGAPRDYKNYIYFAQTTLSGKIFKSDRLSKTFPKLFTMNCFTHDFEDHSDWNKGGGFLGIGDKPACNYGGHLKDTGYIKWNAQGVMKIHKECHVEHHARGQDPADGRNPSDNSSDDYQAQDGSALISNYSLVGKPSDLSIDYHQSDPHDGHTWWYGESCNFVATFYDGTTATFNNIGINFTCGYYTDDELGGSPDSGITGIPECH
jgi:hypothetical protein